MKQYLGYSLTNDTYSQPYIIDYTTRNTQNDYSAALSKIDEGNLQKIAADMHVPYEHRTTPTQSLDHLIDKSNLHVVSESHRQVLHYTSTYWLFAIIAGLLLIWWGFDLLQTLRATQGGRTK
jgi:Ca-activated chloride channel family protein